MIRPISKGEMRGNGRHMNKEIMEGSYEVINRWGKTADGREEEKKNILKK